MSAIFKEILLRISSLEIMRKKDNTELIEAYLNNELTAEDKATFENRLNADKDLVAELALHKQIRGFVKENEVQQLKNQVKVWLQEEVAFVPSEMKVVKKPFLSISGLARIAAILAVVLGIGWFYFSDKNPEMTAEVAQDKYFTELLAQNPGTLQGDDQRSVWIQAFSEKNYDQVILIIEKKQEKTPEEIYYLGLSYSAKGNYAKAIEQLSMKTLQDSVYAEKAEWAIALIYLKQDDKPKAKALLQKIAKSNSEFAEKAKALLK